LTKKDALAVDQSDPAGRVDGGAGEEAQQDDAEHPAHAVHPHTSSASSQRRRFLSCTA
jgi:hypothetical protein